MSLKLTFDVESGCLIQGTAIPPLLRQGKISVELRFWRPDPNGNPGDYTPASMTDYLGARLGIWSDATSTLDDSGAHVLALIPHTDFTYNTDDSDDPYFSGTLNLLTNELVTFLDSARTRPAYFSVSLLRTDLTLDPIFDHGDGAANCIVGAASDDASAVLPTNAIPAYRPITLPVYFASADGQRFYVLTENEAQNGLVFANYSPP